MKTLDCTDVQNYYLKKTIQNGFTPWLYRTGSTKKTISFYVTGSLAMLVFLVALVLFEKRCWLYLM